MRTAILVSMLVLPGFVQAHHSRAHYSQDTVEMDGELIEVQWGNPHVYFVFQSRDSGGEEQLWKMEAGSIYMLERGGVTRELFDEGDAIRVAGNVSRFRTGEFLVSNMLLSSGSEVVLLPNATRRWNDERIGGRDQWEDDQVRLQELGPKADGLFTVWSIPQNLRRQEDFAFTESAIAARSDWDPIENPITQCQQPGMPRIMFGPHPFEFQEEGDRIMLYGDEFDMIRTIHMDANAEPSTEPFSNLGYSVGHWEGNSLVVDTSHIDWPYFDSIGTPLGPDVSIREWFTPSEDGSRLDYRMEIADSDTLVETGVAEWYWLALGESVEPFECDDVFLR